MLIHGCAQRTRKDILARTTRATTIVPKSSESDVPISHSNFTQMRNVKTVSHSTLYTRWLAVFTFNICVTTRCVIGTVRSHIICCCFRIRKIRTSWVFIDSRPHALCDMSRGNIPLSSAPKLCTLFEYDYSKEFD